MSRIIFFTILTVNLQFAIGQTRNVYDGSKKMTNVSYPDSSWIDYKYDDAGNPIGRYRHQLCDKYLPPIVTLSGDSILCFGDSVHLSSSPASHYQWSTGDTLFSTIADTSGIYTLTITYFNGCQKSSHKKITIRPQIRDSIYATICSNQSYSFALQALTHEGIYFDTLTSATGCDSIVSLILSILPVRYDTIAASICQGQAYAFGNQTLVSPGQYLDTAVAANGCDSITLLNLTVLPVFHSSFNATICSDQSYLFKGSYLTVQGIYYDTLTAMNGCDSVVSLILSVSPISTSIVSQSICQGQAYNFNGRMVDSAGLYTDTLAAANGCDSIVTLTATILPTFSTVLNQNVCYGHSYMFYGQTLALGGTYRDTLQAQNGCDSVIILNLNVLPYSGSDITTSICNGQSLSFGSQSITSPGTYYDTLINANGCDSVVVLNLSVLPNSTSSVSATICNNETYNFNGQIIAAAGTYYDTIPSSNGCDSIIMLNLGVLPISTSTDSAAICNGQTYIFFGRHLTASGVYEDTLTSANGCDSVIAFTLTVLPTFSSTLNQTICNGETDSFFGRSLTTAGTYYDTLTAINGCDSIIMLNLTVLPTFNTSVNQSICFGQTYTYNGRTLSSTGVYLDTLTAVNGCDSIISLNLFVSDSSATILNQQICAGQSFFFSGQNVSTAGTYYDTLSTVYGCDSVAILNLSVLPNSATAISATICSNQVDSFNNRALNTAGVYTDTLSSANGCDSVVTLTLVVFPSYNTPLSTTICSNEQYDFNGRFLTVAGIYTDTISSVNGCDSIISLTLTVLPVVSTTINDTVCAGQTILFNGQAIVTSGTYIDTFTSYTGCDSIIMLNAAVLDTFVTVLNQSVCFGQSYFFSGQNIAIPGTYYDTLMSAGGCDSLVTLNLTVLPQTAITQTASICAGQTYSLGSLSLDTAGTYIDTLTSSNGCDSIVMLQLSVLPVSSSSVSATICGDHVYLFNGHSITTSGVYVDTLTSSNGCDSVITLTLTVLSVANTSISDTICQGETYIFEGQNLTLSGLYSDTLVGQNACDSIVTLNLFVLPLVTHSISATVCSNQAYSFNGQSLTTSGIYHDTLTTVRGCDSAVILSLNVLGLIYDSIAESVCSDSSFNFNGHVLNTSGTYVDTLSSSSGCDSIVRLALLVNPAFYPVITQHGDTLSVNSYPAIQWLQNDTPMSGHHSQILITNQSGTYSVSVLDSNGCTGISAGVTITGIQNIAVTPIQLVPNPANDKITLLNLYPGYEYFVKISDVNGRELGSYRLTVASPDIDVTSLASGMYQVQIQNASMGNIVRRFVKCQ